MIKLNIRQPRLYKRILQRTFNVTPKWGTVVSTQKTSLLIWSSNHQNFSFLKTSVPIEGGGKEKRFLSISINLGHYSISHVV